MNAPVTHPPIAVATLTIERFELRCWARAQLFQLGELELHEAVDLLQELAQEDGFVAAIGQDEIQRIMADAFAAVRDFEADCQADTPSEDEVDPHWRKAAQEYHEDRAGRSNIVWSDKDNDEIKRVQRLMSPDVSFERALAEVNARRRPTPQRTIEAILHCVRERGIAALKEPANIERLLRCDADAKAQINHRIAKLGLK
jgi:hypothetical protein